MKSLRIETIRAAPTSQLLKWLLVPGQLVFELAEEHELLAMQYTLGVEQGLAAQLGPAIELLWNEIDRRMPPVNAP
jgi:hypothetical protein